MGDSSAGREEEKSNQKEGEGASQRELNAPECLQQVILQGIEKRRIADDEKERRNFVRRLRDVAE